jgi:hypothetical protein
MPSTMGEGLLKQMINKADTSQKINNTTSIFIITKDQTRHFDLDKATTQCILKWTDGIELTAAINGEKYKTVHGQIWVIRIGDAKTKTITTTFKNEMTRASLTAYGYTPTFEAVAVEPSTTANNNTHEHVKRRKIPKYTLGNYLVYSALRALKVKDIQNLYETIKTDINKNSDTRHKSRKTHAHMVTERQVYESKRELKGMIISELDKNKGQLFASCPMAEKARLEQHIDNIANFDKRIGLTDKYIIDGIYERYKSLGLDKLERWERGRVPRMYANPKEKAPEKKARIISSYFGFPLKRLFKEASRAGTWLLRMLPPEITHFTLHKVDQVKDRLEAAITHIREIYGSNTELSSFQTDVKQMYTFLDHGEICKAIKWLFDIMEKVSPKRAPYNRLLTINRTATTKFPDNVRWGRGTDNETTVTMSFKNLMDIYKLDMNYAFTKSRNIVTYQTIGCPIGGYISAFYANVVCAYHEWQYMTTKAPKEIKIYGIRQMDDLLICIGTEQGNKTQQKMADKVRTTFMTKNEVYKGGLELEEEETKKENIKGVTYNIHEFSGITVKFKTKNPTVTCRTLNKNTEHIKQHGTQKIVRYPHYESYTDNKSKQGIIIGTLNRIEKQNTTTKIGAQSMMENYTEYTTIGYDETTYTGPLQKEKRKQGDLRTNRRAEIADRTIKMIRRTKQLKKRTPKTSDQIQKPKDTKNRNIDRTPTDKTKSREKQEHQM